MNMDLKELTVVILIAFALLAVSYKVGQKAGESHTWKIIKDCPICNPKYEHHSYVEEKNGR